MDGVPYRAALELCSLATEGTQEIKQNLVKSNADSTDMTQEER